MSARLRAPLPQALVIVLFSIGLRLAANQISPQGLPLITPPEQTRKAEPFISLDQAQDLWHRSEAFFLTCGKTCRTGQSRDWLHTPFPCGVIDQTIQELTGERNIRESWR